MNKRDYKGLVVKVDYTSNGYVFKDEQAFIKRLDEPCYIPELALGDFMYTDEEENNHYAVDDYMSIYCYQDFIDIVKEHSKDDNLTDKKIYERAYTLFDMVDWQSPETLILELGFEDEEGK